MKLRQKRAIMGIVIKMLKSFNLSRKEYLERKKDVYKYLFGERKCKQK